MDSFTVNLGVPALAGCLKAAGKNDVRYYLNGVHLDLVAGVMVGSNGHMLLAVSDAIEIEADTPRPEALKFLNLPRDAVADMIKVAKKCRVTSLAVDVDADGKRMSFGSADDRRSISAIDGTYPEWRRICPSEVSGEAGHYDPQLLGQLAEAVTLAGGGARQCATVLYQNGASKPAVMEYRGRSGILGVIMGLRGDPEGQPDCLGVAHPKPKAKAPAAPAAESAGVAA